MRIWIENKVGFLDGYSLMDQPNMILISVDRIPEDFTNWYFDGISLTHRPEQAPEIERYLTPIEKLEQNNIELEGRTNFTEAAILELADMLLG